MLGNGWTEVVALAAVYGIAALVKLRAGEADTYSERPSPDLSPTMILASHPLAVTRSGTGQFFSGCRQAMAEPAI